MKQNDQQMDQLVKLNEDLENAYAQLCKERDQEQE